ncbi:hypothetical protein V8F20_008743 [Naviculisporaceae sp. PSN 640]
MPQPQTPNDADAVINKLTDGFFSRHGLSSTEARNLCWDFVRTEFRDESIVIEEVPVQGFCSYTLLVQTREHTILQFRPKTHRLDLDTSNAARKIYGKLVPHTELLGELVIQKEIHPLKPITNLRPTKTTTSNHKSTDVDKTAPSLLVYSLSRIHGISLAELNSKLCSDAHNQYQHQQRASLVKSFAQIIAQGLSSPFSSARAPRGRISSSIRHRLEIMRRDLPSRFGPVVETLLDALPQIEALPWVLTHGDLVPSNIMIDLSSSPAKESLPTISGLIDWAEAEYLPFGVGIYGLEEFLASSSATPSTSTNGMKYPPPGSIFQYFPHAESLRSLFWAELEKRIRIHFPSPHEWPRLLNTIRLARTLGILLWHGIAFDDGRLDRVVCEGRDDEEIQRLDMHLFCLEEMN